MRPVFRIESLEEAGVPFDSLQDAMAMRPRSVEACIRTSWPQGVCLAEAAVGGREWRLTGAGIEVVAFYGWKVAS